MRFLPCYVLICAIGLASPLAAKTEKLTCVDSHRIRNWIVLDDETLLLDAGHKKYRLDLQRACFNLSTSPTLQFKGDITGRVCGSSLDAIHVQGEQCRISKMTEIDKQTFNEAQKRKTLILKASK